MLSVLALLIAAAQSAGAPATAPATRPTDGPKFVMEQFLDAAHTGDAKAAAVFVLDPDSDATKKMMTRLLDGIAQGQVDMTAGDARTDGDVAIVIMNIVEPNKPDKTEQAPFVHTPNGWKMVFGPKGNVPPEQRARIDALIQAARGAATTRAS